MLGPPTALNISAKKKRKLQQQTDGIMEQPKERLQCEFVIPKKNRRCPLTRKADVQFCAEHLKTKQDDVRVTCPVNGNHTVWSKDVKAHVKKCQAHADESKSAPWYKENHNVVSTESGDQVEEELFDLDYTKWIKVVEDVYKEYEELKLVQLEHEGVEERLKEKQNQKHALQQSSLISHLDSRGLLSSNLNYIEFGCGRAELSRYVLKSVIHKDEDKCDFILIDRSGGRLKLDSKMIKDCEEKSIDTTKIFRVKIDIKDLWLDEIISKEFITDKDFVGISKHLCGAATDLTIQCILSNPQFQTRFRGMIVAMCCRHCCNYKQLHPLSLKYLEQRGIDCQGFKHLMKFASWAVNGRRPDMKDSDGADHQSGLTIKEREELGLKARRIIDESRRFALKQNGYKVELCHYVTREISLENTCMIVTKSTD